MSETRLRILFFAEGATLAHVARPALLVASLDPARFEATLARPASYAWVSDGGNADTRTLACKDSALFAQRLARGLPLYDTATLERYVVDDLALIDAIEPDVVVGDFRLSLSVSARLRDVPYVTICDAYWSPERPLRAVLPVLPFTRFTPIPLARLLFDALSPLAMRLHTLPLERLRARHGLPALGHDLRRCYTDADLRLFANFPALFPELVPRDDTAFLGPLAWSPPAPAAFDAAPTGKPRFAPGEAVTVAELSGQLGIGLMPTREAVQQLASRGAFEFLPNRSVRVPVIAGEELASLFDARFLLEGFATARAAENITREELSRVSANLAQLIEHARTRAAGEWLGGEL